jgi:diguanylate cyclase (GGDEF)-like protein/PAS domain S-box-containing protein
MSPVRSLWLRLPVRGKGLLVVALPTSAAVLLGAFLVAAGVRAASLQDAAKVGRDARGAIDLLLSDALAAESGVRGYLLTGDRGFLEPYNTAEVKMPDALAELRTLMEPFPTARERLDVVEALIADRFQVLDEMVGYVERNDAHGEVPESLIREGDSITDLLRIDVGALDREVEASVLEAESRLQRVQEWAAGAGTLGIVLGVLGGIAAAWLFTRGVANRVAAIERNARHLIEEEPLEAVPTGRDEIARAGRALDEAATLLAERSGQLRESEQRFRSLVHDAVGIVAELDLDMCFTYVSPSVRSVLGYEPEELVGRRVVELVHPDDAALTASELESGIRDPGTTRSALARFLHANGSWRWLSSAGRALPGPDGRATKLIINAQDETDRAEAQQLAARLASIVESSDDAMIATAADSGITAWNDGAARMYGYTSEEMLGSSDDQIVPPDGRDQLEEIRARVSRGERFHLQAVRVARDGHALDVWLTVAPIYDANGTIVGSSSIARDISRRVAAERKLVAAERRLRSILNNMGEGVVVADVEGRFELFNPAAERMLGIGMLAADPERWSREYRVFFPDGVTPFPTDQLPLQRALQGESSDGVEMVVRSPGASDMWLRVTGRSVVDERGDVVAGVMVFPDVTESKQVELAREARRAELERSNRELQDIALVDELTRVPNRRGFLHGAAEQLDLAARSGRKAILLFVDVDHLKSVNDELGHEEGSRLLVDVAEVLTRTGRATDIVARLSGDEFCLFGVGDQQFSEEVLTRRLEEAIATFNAVEGRPYALSLSYGAAVFSPDRPSTLDELMREADDRMYEHKRGKRATRA